MRTKEFYDLDHAQRYITQSVIRIKGKPAYVATAAPADNGFILGYYDMPMNGTRDTVNYTIHKRDEVDMNPFPLGMLAVSKKDKIKGSYYLSRIPVRAWKIGLTESNLRFDAVCEKRMPEMDPRTLLYSHSFVDTVAGKYPELDEALKLSFDRKLPIAFSRRFAVNCEKLLYKTFQVPVGEIRDRHPHLFDNFKHLTQVLDEDFK